MIIYKCTVPLESYPELSHLVDYGRRYFESWIIGSGKLYKFVDNGKERFNELSEDDNFPKEFLTFYVKKGAGKFNENDFLGRNKDEYVEVEKIYLSTRKHEVLMVPNSLIVIQRTKSDIQIIKPEKNFVLTKAFFGNVKTIGNFPLKEDKNLEVTIEKIFKEKIMKQLEAMANFIKPIIAEDVGDIDYHLVHDKDQLFRKISAELFLPIPGILRIGKTRDIKLSRRFDRKTQRPKRPTLHPHKFQLKLICMKIENNVFNYLVDGLKKRFQLPVKILIKYLSKFDIYSVIHSSVQLHRIIVKQSLTPKLKKSIVDLMRRVENEVEKDIEYFESLKKMYYLLCGLLVDFDKKWKVPSVHLTENVQKELLSLDKIYACGSYYGELTLFVTKPLTKSNKQMINKVLQTNKLVNGYRSRLIKIPELYTGPTIKSGFGILFDVGKYLSIGSLGCYVNIQRLGVEEIPQLHAVTCAHCACDKTGQRDTTDQKVYIYNGNGKKLILGRLSHFKYEQHRHDLATIKIDDSMESDCEFRMPDYDKQKCNDWEIFNGELAAKPVYRIGPNSDLTKGVVVCDDTARKIKDEHGCNKFDIEHNIFVDPQSALPDTQRNGGQLEFSEKGDSGSAVCLVHNGKVHVAGLVIGGFEDKEGEGLGTSLCTKLGKAIHDLEINENIKVTPARFQPLPAPSSLGMENLRMGNL